MTTQIPIKPQSGHRAPAPDQCTSSEHRRLPALIACIVIFAVMLLCNLLTDLLVDDYTYSFSFVDGSPIESIADIFPSIAAHAVKMNGRHTAHFFAQLFLFLPHIIFKLLNAALFVMQLVLIVRLSDRKLRLWMVLAAFGFIWLFEPAFGEVNLWLDGACNYLWSYVVCLLWLYPYFSSIDRHWYRRHIALRIAVIPLGFFAGGWNENASAAAIFMAGLIIAVTFFVHRRISFELPLSLIAAVGGFLTMALAPAESKNKIIDVTFELLRANFVAATEMLVNLAPLLILYAILLPLAIMSNADAMTMIKSAILVLGALASNYIMIFASYYHNRSAAFSAVLLAAACVMLLGSLSYVGYRKLIVCTVSLTLTLTAYFMVIGIDDIYSTHKIVAANEEYLIACRDLGGGTATLSPISAGTKYSAVKELKYIDIYDSDTWPNRNMARYYGLDAIYGVEAAAAES